MVRQKSKPGKLVRLSDFLGLQRSTVGVLAAVALLIQQWMNEDDAPDTACSADSPGRLLEKNPQTNLITAFVFGIIGTAGFALIGRDTVTQN